MKIEHIEVYGFKAAFRGLRNPMNSWDKSDSNHGSANIHWRWEFTNGVEILNVPEIPWIGPRDLELACKLVKGGSEHRKFLRQIQIWMDITIPRYMHQELDTYKVATVRNSCSTMHRLGTRDLTQDDFELPIPILLLDELNMIGEHFRNARVMKDTTAMNNIRREYKNLLPEGFLQKATYTMSYETALSMYFQRKNHRLVEWSIKNPDSICSFIYALPYMPDFIAARS